MNNMLDIPRLRSQLLAWYDGQGRRLPWRIRPEDRAKGIMADPYKVWLSEIMLQQTTVAHATPYWYKFLDNFPTVIALADAPRDRVLALWAGLGYYARARNLHKCAQLIRDDYNGTFPASEAELLKLPGIGQYTAATIAAICFNEATNIVDGNVERVIARLYAEDAPLPRSKPRLRALAAPLADPHRPGDYGQALMDLGATLCTPTSPRCTDCPWNFACQAYAKGSPETYPIKIRKQRPIRYGAAFALLNDGAVLLRQRPDEGLLGGMLGLPGTPWQDDRPDNILEYAPLDIGWHQSPTEVRHIFTHFELRLDVYTAKSPNRRIDGVWAELANLKAYALPTLTCKAIASALVVC